MNKKYLNERQLIQYRKRVLKDCEKYAVSKVARIYGIDRSTIYEWRKSIKPKKPGPKERVSWQTPEKLEKEIIRIRKATNYGPKRIKQEFKAITEATKSLGKVVEKHTRREAVKQGIELGYELRKEISDGRFDGKTFYIVLLLSLAKDLIDIKTLGIIGPIINIFVSFTLFIIFFLRRARLRSYLIKKYA